MGKPRGRPKKQSSTSKSEDKPHPDTFPCPFCKKTFKKQGSLTRHVNFHDEFKKVAFDDNDKPMTSNKFSCSECSKKFARKSSLVNHMKTHSVIPCIEEEADATDFENKAEDLFPYECPECFECFSEERFLVAHLKTHNETRVYNCKMCSSTFSHRRALNRHILTHASSKQFKCKFCNATFNDVAARSKHARKHIVWCGMCSCSFKNVDEFRNHIMKHHKSKSSSLKSREAVSDDSFECSDEEGIVGSYAESSDSDSTQDTNIHNTAKSNFECDVQQNVSSGRVSHKLEEEKTDYFMCLECKILFKDKTALQEHSMNCTLLRYMCSSPQCNNMVFNDKSSFLHHMEIKHQSLPYAQEQMPPTKANTNESTVTGQMLNSTFVPLNENVNPTTNESIFESKKPEVYQPGCNVVSNFAQPNLFNQTMLMDPLLLATGFLPQHIDPTTAYIDFNIESYIPWFRKFLDLIKSCEYPLQYELFERISHCLKVISNIIGRPLTKMNEQQNFALLLKLHEEFSKVSEKHLKHIAKNIFK